MDYKETKVKHTVGVTTLDSLGVEIEPLAMLEDMQDMLDSNDDEIACNLWGIVDGSDSTSRSTSCQFSENSSSM